VLVPAAKQNADDRHKALHCSEELCLHLLHQALGDLVQEGHIVGISVEGREASERSRARDWVLHTRHVSERYMNIMEVL
jgi:hypothetical protein